MKIETLLKSTESGQLEKKKSLSQIDEGLEAFCGILNTEMGNGYLVFGIAPDGEPIGLVGDLDSPQLKLFQKVQSKFKPQPLVQINIFNDDHDRKFLVISGTRPTGLPFYEYDGRAWLRVGSATKVLDESERMQLRRSRDRDNHNGPWKCNKCRSIVGLLSQWTFSNNSAKKSYRCQCGGEYCPT